MRRSRSLRLALGMTVALAGGALSFQPAAADGVTDQQREVKRVLAEIDALEEKSGAFAELGVQALDEKAALDGEIAISQTKIAAQQAELATLSGQLSELAVQKVMGGGSGALGPLFTDPRAIDEGLQRDHLARVAVNAGAATTDDFEALLSDLDREQASLTKKQGKAIALAENAEKNRIAADEATVQANAKLAAAESKLGVLIAQERQREEAEAVRQYEQKLRQQQAAAAVAKPPRVVSSGSGNSGGGQTAGGAQTPGAGSDTGGSGTGGSGGGGGGGNVAVSGQAGVAIAAARSQLGVPYRFAAATPGVAFDCSGLTMWAWGRAGVAMPHQSGQQFASIPHVSASEAQPGDLIFYYSPISHVGIYLGGGQMIHSPQTGTSVTYTTVRWEKVVGVARPG